MEGMLRKDERIEYIDCMRGFTMILVVYSHVCIFVLGKSSSINDVFVLFRMPLFFFISGFMVYTDIYFNKWIRKRFKRRLLNQFLPTFVTGGLFVCYTNTNFIDVLFSSYKTGYWFTIVLFEIFLLYLILTIILDLVRATKLTRILIFSLVIVSSLFIQLKMNILSDKSWYGLFCVDFVLKYLRFFLLGVICRMCFFNFVKFVSNRYINAISIVLFLSIYKTYSLNIITVFVLGFLGIIVVYQIFYKNRAVFNTNNKMGKVLSIIGKNTLQVYFLHYFILKGISLNESLSMILLNSWFFELIFCFLLAFTIVTSTLIIDKLLCSFNFIHTLMFGPSFERKNKY